MKNKILLAALLSALSAFSMQASAFSLSSVGAAATSSSAQPAQKQSPQKPSSTSAVPSGSSLSKNGKDNCVQYEAMRNQLMTERVKEIVSVGTPSETMKDMGVQDIMKTNVSILGIGSSLIDWAVQFATNTAVGYVQNKINSTLASLGLPSAFQSVLGQTANGLISKAATGNLSSDQVAGTLKQLPGYLGDAAKSVAGGIAQGQIGSAVGAAQGEINNALSGSPIGNAAAQAGVSAVGQIGNNVTKMAANAINNTVNNTVNTANNTGYFDSSSPPSQKAAQATIMQINGSLSKQGVFVKSAQSIWTGKEWVYKTVLSNGQTRYWRTDGSPL